jgi:hypothetical protein
MITFYCGGNNISLFIRGPPVFQPSNVAINPVTVSIPNRDSSQLSQPVPPAPWPVISSTFHQETVIANPAPPPTLPPHSNLPPVLPPQSDRPHVLPPQSDRPPVLPPQSDHPPVLPPQSEHPPTEPPPPTLPPPSTPGPAPKTPPPRKPTPPVTTFTPLQYHWFYRRDERRLSWRPFSARDSTAIEDAYLNGMLSSSVAFKVHT